MLDWYPFCIQIWIFLYFVLSFRFYGFALTVRCYWFLNCKMEYLQRHICRHGCKEHFSLWCCQDKLCHPLTCVWVFMWWTWSGSWSRLKNSWARRTIIIFNRANTSCEWSADFWKWWVTEKIFLERSISRKYFWEKYSSWNSGRYGLLLLFCILILSSNK